MSAESQSIRPDPIPYERRVEVGEKLIACIGDGARGEAYFDMVIRPNLLPEDMPQGLPQNVRWIGEKSAQSMHRATEALGDMLHKLIDIADMAAEDAVVIAEVLDIPCFYDTVILDFPTVAGNYREQPSSEVSGLAAVHILPARVIESSFGDSAQIYDFPVERVSVAIENAVPATVRQLRPEPEIAKILYYRGRNTI